MSESVLRIMEREILLQQCEILLEGPRTQEELEQEWEFSQGEWNIQDGWICGKHKGNSGGILYSRRSFAEDVLLEFEGRTVPPCSNDLNFTWCAQGWDAAAGDAGISYIAGLAGWWENKVGIERYPDCRVRAATPLFGFEPGRTYFIQAGSVVGHCFVFIDGKLGIELFDPEPIDPCRYGKVGIGTYASWIQVRNFRVRSICSRPLYQEYAPQFD